jgi:hypothetical protein
MLGSCLVLGCSISSFAYRRQESDRFQAPVFALAITIALTAGIAFGVNADLILLGLIPWALCFAMGASVVLHAFLRRTWGLRKRYNYVSCERGEKEVPLYR